MLRWNGAINARRLLIRGALLGLGVMFAAANARSQGATAIAQGVAGFATTARVLMIGAHPDDEDTHLLTWLARGRQVETAYLSLTRGDGGQNLIGNELAEALGAIRTEELLAARRLDGGRQYFTRAYDFGFSKDSAETFAHWPREEVLGDVVRVVRAFRPHVIIAVFSGTAADGHGHHTVSGVLARDAYAYAADTVRFPERGFGLPWTPAKLYRGLRANTASGVVRVNVGEFDVVAGRSYGEIAGESRSQHRSQGFGTLQRRGVSWDYLHREATRVNAMVEAAGETSIFDGIDTSWTRLRSAATTPAQRVLIDSLPALALAARTALDLQSPGGVVPTLARAASLLDRARGENRCRYAASVIRCTELEEDLGRSIEVAHGRVGAAFVAAAGLQIDALADREYLAHGDTATVTLTITNRGAHVVAWRASAVAGDVDGRDSVVRVVAVDSAVTMTRHIVNAQNGSTWWITPREKRDMFVVARDPADGARRPNLVVSGPEVSAVAIAEDARLTNWVDFSLGIGDAQFTYRVGPLEQRRVDPVKGEVRRPLVPLPAVSILFDRVLELARADVTIDRTIRMRVRSYSTRPRRVTVAYKIPSGLRADSLPGTLTLAPLETRDVLLRFRGAVTEGAHALTAVASEGATKYTAGFFTIEYDHIRPIVMWRESGLWLEGVTTAIPEGVAALYVRGVSDDVAPVLNQLDVAIKPIDPGEFASEDLARYGIVILGPRLYARMPDFTRFSERLVEFARRGGTVVVQYGQQEMTRPGVLPFPIEIANQAQRVTMENAPVRIVDSSARVLTYPNRITEGDFGGWIQERALYMPARADTAWKPVLEMNDPGETPNRNALLVARIGDGAYVYTTMSFLRQLPSGNGGAIRLFMNLLSAGRRPSTQ